MNLNTIIERKKEEFEKSMTCIDECKNGFYEDIGCPAHGEDAIKAKKFLEKAIRESVEEALRDVRPQPSYSKTNWKTCLDEFDVRVNEFMK